MKRLVTINEAAEYLSMGRNRTYDFVRRVGAFRKFGRRSFVDIAVLDEAISSGEIFDQEVR